MFSTTVSQVMDISSSGKYVAKVNDLVEMAIAQLRSEHPASSSSVQLAFNAPSITYVRADANDSVHHVIVTVTAVEMAYNSGFSSWVPRVPVA